MRFGLCIPHFGRDISADDLRTTLQRAEALGYDSVWVSDHVVTPEHLLSSVGPTFYDAFVVLSYAAAFTRRVKLGSSVIVVPYRNPLVVAKMLATLDVLSQGRVIFGVGAGGAPDEFKALGVPSSQRGRRTDEYLRLMIALWTEDPTDFRGRFFSFEGVRFQPKPLQKPHPPIWVGGRSDAALRRAVALGQAWHPTAMPMDRLVGRMEQLTRFAEDAGQPEGPVVTVHQGIRITANSVPTDGDQRRPGRGTTAELREDMARYRELGIADVVCNFSTSGPGELSEAMEMFASDVMAYFPEGA